MSLSISPPPTPQAARKQRPPLSVTRGKQLRRLNELRRLADLRWQLDQPLGDLKLWAKLFADVLLHHSKGHDLFVFRDALQTTMLAIDDDMALEALHEVARIAKWRGMDYRPISPTTAGKWLELTSEECWLCDITTIKPIDGPVETAADVKARRMEQDRQRKHEERSMANAAELERIRERDRERSRKHRAAKGAKPHAQSLSRTRPWEALGISRSTYERRIRDAKTSTPTRDAKTSLHPLLREGVWSDEFTSTVRGVKRGGPASRPGCRAENVERKEAGRDGLVAKTSNGQRLRQQRVATKKRRLAEKDLPLRADGSVSPEFAALGELATFDNIILVETWH